MEDIEISHTCLIFPYSRANGNAISALLASLDTDPLLKQLPIYLPDLKAEPKDLVVDEEHQEKIILAFSVFTTQLPLVSAKIRAYRDYFSTSELLVVAGGPHAIGDPFSMLLNGADIVCTGEGEVVIREIIKSYLGSKNYETVKGIAFISNEQELIRTAKPDPLDLSDFPPFSTRHQLIRPIEITRGCAWKCRFCQIRSKGGTPVRHRPLSQILEYVRYTVQYFSERRPDIRFVSPNALSYGSADGRKLNLNKVEELLSDIRDIIGESGNIYFGSFPSEVRPETITQASVKILKRYSDSKTIILGGQSGSDNLLRSTSRGHDSEETERAARLLISAGFEVDVDIIFGLPGETEKDVKKTISHMQKLLDLGAKIHSHTFLPLVGTPLANENPGVIHQFYRDFISTLPDSSQLRGQHIKQEQEAKEMAERRKTELEKRSEYDRIRLL